jgi:hypothetical protein
MMPLTNRATFIDVEIMIPIVLYFHNAITGFGVVFSDPLKK